MGIPWRKLMGWKLKLAIAGAIVLILLLVAPNVFGQVFGTLKDTAISCDNTLRDTKMPDLSGKNK